MELYFECLEGWSAPSDVFISLFANEPYAFWLDREHSLDDPFSVIGSGVPAAVSELEPLVVNVQLPFAYRPGLVGAFGYEESSDSFLRVDRALVFDHKKRDIWFIGLFANESDFRHWVQAALLRIALSGGQTATYRHEAKVPEYANVTLRHQPKRYLELIELAKHHISIGDVYQLCLTNELSAKGNADALEAFLSLREKNPTPYATYLSLGAKKIVCSSPEQFLKINSDGSVSTKPIKGTRRRDSNPDIDDALARELESSEKERAENLMIVDLMRNDLGKVCEANSVAVTKLFEVQSYKTVHQLVSTVTGKLQKGVGVLDVMKAAFPGGSMTGAPKLRAMELIKEFEAGERGIYSGAVGYLGVDGSADLGMTIRTIVFDKDAISIGIGGGITADSVPSEELEETRIKAKALLDVLRLDDPWS